MKKNFLVVCSFALALMACNSNDSKPENRMHEAFNMTDEQMFAYLLGNQFGGQSFSNAPLQFGEYLDLDAMVQGILDNSKFSKDSSAQMQMSADSMTAISDRYSKVMDARVKTYTPDSTKLASLGNDPARIMSYVDSVRKTLPVTSPIPVKKQPVTINEKSSQNQKYSYATGVQLNLMFESVGRNLEQLLDVDYFVLGLREKAMNFLDSSFAMQVPMDSLKAVNGRYVQKMQKILERRRAERMAQ